MRTPLELFDVIQMDNVGSKDVLIIIYEQNVRSIIKMTSRRLPVFRGLTATKQNENFFSKRLYRILAESFKKLNRACKKYWMP